LETTRGRSSISWSIISWSNRLENHYLLRNFRAWKNGWCCWLSLLP
jgi:hypothetical protein